MIQGKSSRALAPELRKIFGIKKYEAERLMRTELTRVRTDTQLASFQENGFERYRFLNFTSAPYTKNPVCEICKEVGKKCEEEKGFLLKDAMPGENAPPMHPGCRCSISAYMDEEEYNDWLNNKPKGSENADEIEAEKPPEPLKNQDKSGTMKKDEKGMFVLDENGNRLRCSIGEIPKSQIAKMKEKNGWHADWKELATRNEIYGLYTDDGVLQSAMACHIDKDMGGMYINWIVGNPSRTTHDVGEPLLAEAMRLSWDAGYYGDSVGDAANQNLVNYYVDKWGAEYVGGGNGYRIIWTQQSVINSMRKYGIMN